MILIYFFIFAICLFHPCQSTDVIQENWVSPDIWSRAETNDDFNNINENDNGMKELCPVCHCNRNTNHIENAAHFYYKKLINILIDSKKLEFDIETNTYYRAIKIPINQLQIKNFEKSNDPRDWDSVLSEIIPKIDTFTIYPKGRFYWIKSIINDFTELIQTTINIIGSIFFGITEYILNWIKTTLNAVLYIFCLPFSGDFRFVSYIFLGVMFIFYFYKKFGNFVFLVLFGLFISGFVIHYMECNRKLEARNLADYFDISSDNPCSDDWKNKEKNMWNMWGLLNSQPTKAQCLSYLEKKNKLRLPYCRPDHVLLSYLNEIILFQFKLTVEKSTDIFKEINSLIPFPYNIVASIIFGLTLMQFLSLIFQYVISPRNYLSNWWWNSDLPQQSSGGRSSPIQTNTDDKLSGKNLDSLFKLIKDYTKLKFQTSGVQVIEHITHKETNVDNKKEEISKFSHQENKDEDIILLKINKTKLHLTSNKIDREINFKREEIEDITNKDMTSFLNDNNNFNSNKKILEGSSNENKIGDCNKNILEQNSNDSINCNCVEKISEQSRNEDDVESNCGKDIKEMHFESNSKEQYSNTKNSDDEFYIIEESF